jgi:SAM-dependent methyltransferase
MSQPLLAICARYEAYLRYGVSTVICEYDGMYDRGRGDPMGHYMAVGRSAIDVLARAMMLASKSEIETVLDLPCGGGRVTRHLKAFFPESQIFASELDQRLEDFVVNTLAATRFHAAADFSSEPERQFDLVFVGSLLTHFDEAKFRRTLGWFIQALAPDGLLVLTTHGRQHDLRQRRVRQFVPAADWEPVYQSFLATGFGYLAYPGQDYGLSLCQPSWLIGLVETDPSVRIVNFQEGVWNQHHDILVLQKQALTGGPPIEQVPPPVSV